MLFALIYNILPEVKIRWRDVWTGAVLTAALFVLGKFLIGLYLGRGTFTSAFGAAGSLVVILLWIYYSAQILLLGAEFTHLYALRQGAPATVAAVAKADAALRQDGAGVSERRGWIGYLTGLSLGYLMARSEGRRATARPSPRPE